MKYNFIKKATVSSESLNKSSPTKSFSLHTSLNSHLHVILFYLFALHMRNVTDLHVSGKRIGWEGYETLWFKP